MMHHMEAIGYDARVREVEANQSTIVGRQIHAHHANLGLAFQPLKISFEREFRAAQHYVIDSVILQIAQRGGIAGAPGEEMFVDAQHLWAAGGMPLAELALEAVPEVALDGCGADPLASSQPAAIDSIQVIAENHFLVGFAGSLARQNTREPLTEILAALLAMPFMRFQF